MTYVAFPSRRKMQERENCRVADTTFLDRGLNLSLTSVCVGIGLAYCFMFILLVAKAFLRPDGDSCGGRGRRWIEEIITREKENKLKTKKKISLLMFSNNNVSVACQ